MPTAPNSLAECAFQALPFFPEPQSLRVIAHRGGSLEAPENTMAAFCRAQALGADWLETDVGLSADGVPVCLHDDTLSRTAGHPGVLSDLPVAELLALRCGVPSHHPDTLAAMAAARIGPVPPFVDDGIVDVCVPSLRRALGLPNSRWMLELKRTTRPEALVDAVLEDVVAAGAQDRVALASFEPELLALSAQKAPHIARIGVAETMAEARIMLSLQISALACHVPLAAQALAATPPSIALWCWTVYDAATAHALLALGVAGIITDAPRAVLASLGQP